MLPGPLIALVFLVFVLAMAVELSIDLVRVRQLACELHDSRERMRLRGVSVDITARKRLEDEAQRHRTHLMTKLGVASLAELVQLAVAAGLSQPE